MSMTVEEARALIDDLETEIQDRLPESAGAVLVIFNTQTGQSYYSSTLKREVAVSLLGQFVKRNTQ